jgi:competence protein
VAGLAAAKGHRRRRCDDHARRHRRRRALRRLHFHRLSHYGVVANLISLPLVGLLIMPFALLGLIAMPLGLEFWPLQIMGLGIDLLVATGKWVASWPGAVSVLPSISGPALLLLVLGGLWLCLWQTRWRALGLVIAAIGLLVSGEGTRPDVLIERDGRNVALRTEDGTLALPPATRANYSVDNWLLADGEERDAEEVAASSPFRCDLLGCIGKVRVRPSQLSAIQRRWKRTAISPTSSSRRSASAKDARRRRVWLSTGAHCKPKARTRSTSKGCRSGAKASPRHAGGGLGCLSARSPSLHCRQAKPMPAIRARPRKRPIPASTAIPMSEA